MTLKIRRIAQPSELNGFVEFPFRLYRESPWWVPPLVSSELKFLNPAKNPAAAECHPALFMAMEGRRVVGRIAAMACRTSNGVQGRFGWYDAVDDMAVSEKLLEEAATWVKSKGADSLTGPMGFTNMDKAGLLTEGFEELPTASELYNYPYYATHLESLGFTKAKDFIGFRMEVPEQMPERVERMAGLVRKKYDLQVVQSAEEIRRHALEVFDLMKETHGRIFGFREFSDPVKAFYLRQYETFLHPDFLSLVVDRSGVLQAFALTMPSLSAGLQKARGRLFPFGFVHLARAMKKPETADSLMLGVRPELMRKGVPALMLEHLIRTFHKHGVRHVESNPGVEDNDALFALWRHYPHRIHKRRRVYQKQLSHGR